jgi:hypothetical protein
MTTALSLNLSSQNLLAPLLVSSIDFKNQQKEALLEAVVTRKVGTTTSLYGDQSDPGVALTSSYADAAAQGQKLTPAEQRAALAENAAATTARILDFLA